jgi:glyoxylase I family protein
MKLQQIMIFVPDLVEAKRFYCDLLGFGLIEETDSCLTFDHDGCSFVAYLCDTGSEVRNYSREARSVFVFEVDSLDRRLASLRAKGVTVLHDVPSENDRGRYAAFADPFGNVHEIWEPRP